MIIMAGTVPDLAQDSPVKDVVVGEALTDKELAEEFTQVHVIWLILEADGPHVVQVCRKLLCACGQIRTGLPCLAG